MNTQKLSIFSIVKNEHEMCSGAWESVKGADELVIVDTGSTDDTVEIAKTYTDNVYYFEWQDDFSLAKNYAMSKCTGDWVMGLDADWRLEEGGIEKIREAIDKYGEEHDVINVTLVFSGSPGHAHIMPNIFKNDGSIKYSGAVHESVNKPGFSNGEVKINYCYGPSHKLDPDRNIRILKKEMENQPNNPRWIFYLAREYYYRNDFSTAFSLFAKYIGMSKFKAEKGDAYLIAAKCLFHLNRGDEAREHCLRAIEINPDHEEALRFMADIHYEPWKRKWLQFAEIAENRGVLFVVNRA